MSQPVPANRVLTVIGLGFAALSLVLNLMGWIREGELSRRGLAGASGIGLLLVAGLVGSRRRGVYYALIVVSLGLAVVSFLL